MTLQSADQEATGRFGSLFETPWDQKSTLWTTIFDQKVAKGAVVFSRRRILGATCEQTCPQGTPKSKFHRFGSALGAILICFWLYFGHIQASTSTETHNCTNTQLTYRHDNTHAYKHSKTQRYQYTYKHSKHNVTNAQTHTH